MSLKHGLLGLLNYGPNTGYELDKIFKASLHFFWKAQTSQIYRELNAMEEHGLLTSEVVYQTDSPNKKIYSISESGKSALHRWITEDEISENIGTRNVFLMKMFFSGEDNVENSLRLLKNFIQKNNNDLENLNETDSSIAQYGRHVADEKILYWEFVARYGKSIRQMNIEWAEECISRLEALR